MSIDLGAVELIRILPEPGRVTVESAVGELLLSGAAPDERPYVVTNFVLTLDGRATIEGRSGPIGSDSDTAMLVGLRTAVDAVMIGAGTMRAERYGSPVTDRAKREQRERRGLVPDPLMVLVSNRFDIPWDAPLFTEPGSDIVIFTSSVEREPETAARVDVVRHEGRVDLARALAHLRHERDIRSLLCEGGPRLHASLIDEGLVDELFVTHAPKLGGGSGPGLVTGLSERERELSLRWLLVEPATDELFARYAVHPLGGASG